MTLVERKNYYLAFIYFQLACLAQSEVRRFTKMLSDAMGQDNIRLVDSLSDNVYDPDTKGTEDEFEKILRAHDVQMDWVDWSVKTNGAQSAEDSSVPKKKKK